MENLWTIGIVGAATGLWLLYLNRLDEHRSRKGREHAIAMMMLVGGLSIVPTLWAYDLNPFTYRNWGGPFLYNFAVVGLTEELVKFLSFILVARITGSIREPQDGIVQGAAVGVGFSAVEDVAYGLLYGPAVALERSLLIGVHALAGALWGYLWAGAIYENTLARNPQAYRSALMGFVPLAVLHSLYNSIWYWTGTSGAGYLWNGVLLAAMLVAARKAYRYFRSRSPYHAFSYRDHRTAIVCIRRGLARSPESVVLKRRLAIYQLAAGRPGASAELLREVASRCRTGERTLVMLFYGVALMAAGKSIAGESVVRKNWSGIDSGSRTRLEREIRSITGNAALAARVGLLVTPVAERLPDIRAVEETARPVRVA